MVAEGKARPPSKRGMPDVIEDLLPEVESLADAVIAERDKERSNLSDVAIDADRKALVMHFACNNMPAMAIEIPDLPDDVAKMYRLRAELAGVSLSSYLRDCLIIQARWRDKAKAMATVREALAASPSPGISWETIDEIRREMRGE